MFFPGHRADRNQGFGQFDKPVFVDQVNGVGHDLSPESIVGYNFDIQSLFLLLTSYALLFSHTTFPPTIVISAWISLISSSGTVK